MTKQEAAETLKQMGFDAEVERKTYGEIVTVYGADYDTIRKIMANIGYEASFGVRRERMND